MSEQQGTADAVVERFQSTSSPFGGILGLGTAAAILALAVAARSTGTALGIGILAVLGALLSWMVLLRPALWRTSSDLVMRNMLRTDRIPLAAIDKVVVTQVLAVFAGDKRYVSPAVGYTVRQTVRARSRPTGEPTGNEGATHSHQDFVEVRLNHLAQDSRERLGIRKGSPEQQALLADVRRSWAWPELVGIAACVLAFATWLAV